MTPQARISDCRLKPVVSCKMNDVGDQIRIGTDGLLFDYSNRAYLRATARHNADNPIIVTREKNGFCVDIRAVPGFKWEPGPISWGVYRVHRLIEPPCESKPCKPCKPHRHHHHGRHHRA